MSSSSSSSSSAAPPARTAPASSSSSSAEPPAPTAPARVEPPARTAPAPPARVEPPARGRRGSQRPSAAFDVAADGALHGRFFLLQKFGPTSFLVEEAPPADDAVDQADDSSDHAERISSDERTSNDEAAESSASCSSIARSREGGRFKVCLGSPFHVCSCRGAGTASGKTSYDSFSSFCLHVDVVRTSHHTCICRVQILHCWT